MHSRCDNCQRVWQTKNLGEAPHLAIRLEPGGPLPSGECPSCGALCYEIGTFTPGPWHAEGHHVLADNGDLIATATDDASTLLPDESLANANLMADAPELLFRLEALADAYENDLTRAEGRAAVHSHQLTLAQRLVEKHRKEP